jgi:hypothetical protein
MRAAATPAHVARMPNRTPVAAIAVTVACALARPGAAEPAASPSTGAHQAPPARAPRRLTLTAALALVDDAPDLHASLAGTPAWSTTLAARTPGFGWRAAVAAGAAAWAPAVDGELAATWTPGRSRAHAHVAQADVARVTAERRARAAARRAAAARAWLAAWQARASWALAEEEVAAAVALRAATARARALGAATVVDEAAADAYTVAAELRRLEADGRIADTTLDLAAALALPGDAEPIPAGSLPTLDEDGPARSLTADARAAAAAAERARSQAAGVDARPQLELGVRLEHRVDADAGFLTLAVQLPEGDGGRRERAAALARAAVADGEAELARREQVVEQDRARHDVEHAVEQMALARRLVTARVAYVDALARARQGGEALVPELALARGELALARAGLLEAEVRHAEACLRRAWAAGWEAR